MKQEKKNSNLYTLEELDGKNKQRLLRDRYHDRFTIGRYDLRNFKFNSPASYAGLIFGAGIPIIISCLANWLLK